jgi:hypothetical protein
MAGDNEGTLNQDSGMFRSTVEDSSASMHADEDFELSGRSTVEDNDLGPGEQPSEERLNTGKDKAETDGGKKGAAEEGKDKVKETDDDEIPEEFHKHRAWQRILSERNDLREKLAKAEGHIEGLSKTTDRQTQQTRDQQQGDDLPKLPAHIKDLSKMTAEEKAEWRTDDPDGYEKNLIEYTEWKSQRGVIEFAREQAAKAEQHSQVESLSKALDGYKAEHPDFEGLWNDGSIKKYMAEHPLVRTPTHAYEAMTQDKRTKDAVDTAVKEAVEKTKKEMLDNFQAKREASTFRKGPAPRGATADEDLKDTSKRGGVISTLAERLERRRAGI